MSVTVDQIAPISLETDRGSENSIQTKPTVNCGIDVFSSAESFYSAEEALSLRSDTNYQTSKSISYKNLVLNKMLNSDNGIKLSFHDLTSVMSLHPRTLQRRLKIEGTCYIQLKDEARLILAKQYLANTRNSVEQIAESLDFTERTSFTRAFKRWTSQTPMQFRKHNREQLATENGETEPSQ